MDKAGQSLYEKIVSRVLDLIREYKVPLIMTWVTGLAAHMYMFTNKIINHDEALYLFGKGGTIGSGRWLLALTSYIFPDFSMPWIYGIISLGITAAAICFIIKIFDIRDRYLQGLLAGLIVCFPAQTSIFCFMFTSAPYALALLGSVSAVYVYANGGGAKRFALSCMILTLTLGIYQGYIAMTSSLFIILMIQGLLRGKAAKQVFREGLLYVCILTVSLAAYFVITKAVCALSGTELISYGYSEDGILFRVLLAYNGFLRSFISGYFGFVNSPVSMAAHGAFVVLAVILAVRFIVKSKRTAEAVLILFCAAILPMSINCLYLIAETGVINSWTMYPFVCVYILAAVIADVLMEKDWLRDVLLVSLTLIIISNVYFANKVYLKMQLGNDSMFAYYTALAADIRKSPEYREGMVVAILGEETDMVEYLDEVDTGYFTGPADNTVNMYTRNYYVNYFVGLDVPTLPYLDTYKIRGDIEATEKYASMPEYPAEGSIAEINGYLVVKLG